MMRLGQQVDVRWMIRRDMDEILEIEQISFQNPWSMQDFLTALKQRNCIGMVAEEDRFIHGFMIYELKKDHLNLMNIAVHPDSRRQGVGWKMLAKLYSKLAVNRRERVVTRVRESNLPAQLFFSHCGWTAFKVAPDEYRDTNEDAYLFERWYLPQD